MSSSIFSFKAINAFYGFIIITTIMTSCISSSHEDQIGYYKTKKESNSYYGPSKHSESEIIPEDTVVNISSVFEHWLIYEKNGKEMYVQQKDLKPCSKSEIKKLLGPEAAKDVKVAVSGRRPWTLYARLIRGIPSDMKNGRWYIAIIHMLIIPFYLLSLCCIGISFTRYRWLLALLFFAISYFTFLRLFAVVFLLSYWTLYNKKLKNDEVEGIIYLLAGLIFIYVIVVGCIQTGFKGLFGAILYITVNVVPLYFYCKEIKKHRCPHCNMYIQHTEIEREIVDYSTEEEKGTKTDYLGTHRSIIDGKKYRYYNQSRGIFTKTTIHYRITNRCPLCGQSHTYNQRTSSSSFAPSK